MPISFEQAQPFDEATSRGYGGLQQQMQDREFYQRANTQNAQLQLAAQQQNFDQQRAVAAFNQNAYQFEAQRQPSMRDQWLQEAENQQRQQQQQHQMDYQRQGFDLQAQLHQTQLSQAERMRMERLQHQVSYIEQNTGTGDGDGMFSPVEARDMITQLRTGLDPLSQRAMRSQQITQQLQQQQLRQQIAEQEAIQQQNAEFRARSLPQRIQRVTNPETGESLDMFETRPGMFEPVPWDGGRRIQAEAVERELYGGSTRRDIEDQIRSRIMQANGMPNRQTFEQFHDQEAFRSEVNAELTRRSIAPRTRQQLANMALSVERQIDAELNPRTGQPPWTPPAGQRDTPEVREQWREQQFRLRMQRHRRALELESGGLAHQSPEAARHELGVLLGDDRPFVGPRVPPEGDVNMWDLTSMNPSLGIPRIRDEIIRQTSATNPSSGMLERRRVMESLLRQIEALVAQHGPRRGMPPGIASQYDQIMNQIRYPARPAPLGIP